MMSRLLSGALFGLLVAASPRIAEAVPELVMPGTASSAEYSEIRITFSPDGKRRLWGVVRNDLAPGKLVIVESVKGKTGWSVPRTVPFASDANDFDPFFAPDGRSVLFFSNRPGGQGQDDLWQVPFDPRTGHYGTPVNLGPKVNTLGKEWAPGLSADGKTLLFSSDGHGGAGKQDLFLATRAANGHWTDPVGLGPGVNGKEDDFDAAFVGADRLVYTSGDSENGPIHLYIARRVKGRFAGRERLPAPFNCSQDFNLGPAWHAAEPRRLYYSAACPAIGRGRADVFAAELPR